MRSIHDPRTYLGRPWQARSWLVPVFGWAIAVIVAWVVHELRAAGVLTVPADMLDSAGRAVTLAGAGVGLLVVVIAWRRGSWRLALFAAGPALIVAWLVHEVRAAGALTATAVVFAGAGLIITAILGAVGVLVASGDDFTGEIRVALSGSGITLGLWLTVVTATDSAWTLGGIAAGAVLCAVTGCVYCWGRQEQYRYERDGGSASKRAAAARAAADAAPVVEPEPEPELTAEQLEAERWNRVLASIGARGVEYIHRGASKAGPVIHFRLPDDGSITYSTLVGLFEKLEVALPRQLREFKGLRPAALRLKKARTRSGQEITTEVYLHIDVRNILKKIVRIPDDHGPLSVYDAFPFGELTDTGETLYLTLREIHVMIVGQTGKGKSNLLHVLIFQLSRCEDALLWVYDGKGGRTLRPWLRAWLRRETDPTTGRPLDRPIVDWPAINRVEAERMFAAAIGAAESRPGLMDGSKWRATPEQPAIFVIADELSQATGNHVGPSYSEDDAPTSAQLDKLITQGVILGRGEAVWWWTANQRSTVTMGASGDAQSQFGGRLMLPVETADEARSMLAKSGPEAAHLAGQLTEPGSVVAQGFGLVGYEVAKLFFVGDDDELMQTIEKAVLWHTQYRPVLDAATAAELEPYGYADRWTDPDRTAWMYGRKPAAPLLRYGVPAKPGPAPAPAAPAANGSTSTATRPRSAADTLGLPPTAGSPWGSKSGGPAPADVAALVQPNADEAAEWDKLAREFDANGRKSEPEPEDDGAVPPPPEPDAAAAVPQQARGRRRGDYRRARPHMVKILEDVKGEGIMAMDMYRALVGRGEAPARPNMYDWMARLVDDGYAVQPTGTTNGRYYHPHHWKG